MYHVKLGVCSRKYIISLLKLGQESRIIG